MLSTYGESPSVLGGTGSTESIPSIIVGAAKADGGVLREKCSQYMVRLCVFNSVPI